MSASRRTGVSASLNLGLVLPSGILFLRSSAKLLLFIRCSGSLTLRCPDTLSASLRLRGLPFLVLARLIFVSWRLSPSLDSLAAPSRCSPRHSPIELCYSLPF